MTAEPEPPTLSANHAVDHQPRRTSLHAVHVDAGAALTDFAGWSMPLRYASEVSEHRSVRHAAGLFDLGHMGQIDVLGPQAASALDRALVSDVASMRPGRAKYTMMCADDGGVVDDLIVYRLDDHRFLVVANASNTEVVLRQLRERTAGLAVHISDRLGESGLLAVQGPRASATLSELTRTDLGVLGYYTIVEATIARRPVLLARTGYTGEDGFEMFCHAEHAADLWSALLSAGEPHALVPAGLACRDTLRLEAGMPLYGHELSLSVTPYDAGLGKVVALQKAADFVGREALTRHAGREPSRRLVGLVADGRRVPRAGHTVLDPMSATPVGKVTSGAPSPTLGQPIAMAYVDTDLAHPGTAVMVDIRGHHQPAQVSPLPFYRRSR